VNLIGNLVYKLNFAFKIMGFVFVNFNNI